MNKLNQLVRLALDIRADHQRCKELSEALRQETSWINQTGTAHQLDSRLDQWRKNLADYWRLSAEYGRVCPEEEVFTIHNLDKMVADYNQAR